MELIKSENGSEKNIPELIKIKGTFNQNIYRCGVQMKKEETHLFTNKFKE